MENSEGYDLMEGVQSIKLEDRIKTVIVKIKGKRSRPCYQNILTHINRNLQRQVGNGGFARDFKRCG